LGRPALKHQCSPPRPAGPAPAMAHQGTPAASSHLRCQVGPAGQPYPPLLPLARGPRVAAHPYPHQPRQHTEPPPLRRRSRRTRTRGAGRGRTTRPARTPRTSARARDWMRPRGKAKDGSAPLREHPRRPQAAASSATCPVRRAARGMEGFSPRAARGVDSKGAGRCGTEAKPPTPSWGLLFHHRPWAPD
jgi:hypothetical protein